MVERGFRWREGKTKVVVALREEREVKVSIDKEEVMAITHLFCLPRGRGEEGGEGKIEKKGEDEEREEKSGVKKSAPFIPL